MRKFLMMLFAAAVIGLAILVLLSQRGPTDMGLKDGALRGCDGQAGCVNSQIGPTETRVEPLYVGPEVHKAWGHLQRIVTQGRGQLQRVEGSWMAFEWRAPWLRFVDDFECLRLDSAGVIHVRAASRLGSVGFGTHTESVAELRQALLDALAGPSQPAGE